MYRSINADLVTETVHTLHLRISERFPDHGLSRVCRELLDVAKEANGQLRWIQKANVPLRIAIGIGLVTIVGLCVGGISQLNFSRDMPTLPEFIQAVEAGLNEVVILSAAAYFLLTIETRIKRNKVLKALRDLRALAHIIDMHQLTKDPEKLLHHSDDTESSPKQTMTAFELTRYLDYCSEMLSLIGKLAALYIQQFNDAQALAAVNEIESLTTSLSEKVWQKIMVLHSFK